MLDKFAKNKHWLNNEYLDRCLYAVGQSEDEDCFVVVYDFYAGRVKSHMLRKGVNETIAEDLTQQIMLTVWRTAATFNPTSIAASTWIFSIVRNRWLEYNRGCFRIEIDPSDEIVTAASL